MTSMSVRSEMQGALDAGGIGPLWGLLRRALVRVIEMRSASIERLVAEDLKGLTDARLADLGYADTDIAWLRAGRPLGQILDRE